MKQSEGLCLCLSVCQSVCFLVSVYAFVVAASVVVYNAARTLDWRYDAARSAYLPCLVIAGPEYSPNCTVGSKTFIIRSRAVLLCSLWHACWLYTNRQTFCKARSTLLDKKVLFRPDLKVSVHQYIAALVG